MSRENDLHGRRSKLSLEKQKLLEQKLRGARGTQAVSRIERRNGAEPALLSFAQQRLWFLDQLEPNLSVYTIAGALRVIGELDKLALEKSLNELVRRHESLRTTFVVENNVPTQVIVPELVLALTVTDLQDLPKSERRPEALRLANEEARQPFNLARGPLLRCQLLQVSSDEHWLVLAMHHITADGWSMGILVGELASLYNAFSSGKPSTLPELAIQYADYAQWQRQWLQGQVLESQLSYWKQELSNLPPALDLPMDKPRRAIQSYRGVYHSFTLPSDLIAKLRVLSQQAGVTPAMTLLAAFQVLLYRYTGQSDLCVGLPIANRNRAELEALIGFFVNTLVVRANLAGSPSFLDFLMQVRETTLRAYAHQDLPFEMLVDALRPTRDQSVNPLFQVAFVFQNTPMPALHMQGLTADWIHIETGTSKFDITMELTEGESGKLAGKIEYATDLFEADTIARMAQHFQTLLESATINPNCSVSQLPLLSAVERHKLLDEFNATAADYSSHKCLHQLVEEQVERTPEAVAVVVGEQQLTYRELNTRANQLAHYLIERGAAPDTLIGVACERSLEVVISILGVLKAGAAYVPLDPQYPADRLTFMLVDSHAALLLSQAHLVERLPASAVPTIRLDADWPQIARKKCDNPDAGVVGQNLAYVIYTSGSTGQPKGVQIEHHSACHAIAAHVAQFGLDQTSCVLQFASPSFDVSVAEIFSALVSGARLCLARLDTSTSLEEFVRALREARVTLMMLPPSVWAIIPEVELPDLRTVISGGEICPAALVERWGRGREFYNVYGPTEATICAAWARCEAADSRQPPIGRPVPNTQLYILDAFLQPVPIGLVGELYIGGVQLARGYLNRPELTAERFIRHPFSAEAGARLYRTGDLARYRSDGNIEFVGRADQQVKVRGFRIELGEIEAALLSHPSVHQAAVMVREDGPGDRRLVAYVVGDPAAVAATDLRAYLKAHLPDYMVPAALVVMAELPLSPNGKIDQRALPDPHQGRLDLEATYVVPQTEVERIIAATWQEVLDVDRIGIHDNFFDLGGHSLLIVQVYSKLRQVLDRAFSIIDLFQYPTICSLAKYLSTQLDELPSRHEIQDRAKQQKTALARQKQLVSKVRGIGK